MSCALADGNPFETHRAQNNVFDVQREEKKAE